jgi:hypothetical protein
MNLYVADPSVVRINRLDFAPSALQVAYNREVIVCD